MMTNKEDVRFFDKDGKQLQIGDAIEYKQNLNSVESVVEGIIIDVIPTNIVGGIGYKVDISPTSYRSFVNLRAWSHQVSKRDAKRVAV